MKMAIFLLLLFLLPDVYLWFTQVRHLPLLWRVIASLAVFVPTLMVLLMFSMLRTPLQQEWMFRVATTLVLTLLLPKLLYMIVSLLGVGANGIGQMMTHNPLRISHYVNVVATIFSLMAMCIIGYGMTIGWRKQTVNEQTLRFADLPKGFDGYRIVQLSDMHIGTYSTAPECVDRIVETVNSLHPDAIVFTGDMVNSSPTELDKFMNVMSRLKAKDGIFSIMGNHDYCMYQRYDSPRGQAEAVQELQRRERSWGWNLLLNEHTVLHRGGDSLAIVGVENSSRPPFPDYGNLPKAQEGLPDGIFKILLSHDPTHWRREVTGTDIQLQLSGHTHATQFKVFGWSPASFVYDEWGGLYTTAGDGKTSGGKQTLFVSTGVGENVPFRFGVWPEIVLITLKKQ